MELTMTWSLIGAGSALLLIGVAGRQIWPRLKFWLALTQAAAYRAPEGIEDQAFQDNLHRLATRTSGQRGLPPSKIAAPQLDQATPEASTLVG